MANPHDTFRQALDQHPEDTTTRLVYADWLEEHARPDHAFAQRWMAHRGMRPGHRTTTDSGRRVPERYAWAWWVDGPGMNGVYPGHALLPWQVFYTLPRTPLN